MKYLLVLLTLLAHSLANANYEAVTDEGGWINRDGTRIPNTDNMKSIKGFGGWLIVTPDTDWESINMNRPPI